jgi:hypothetical protein
MEPCERWLAPPPPPPLGRMICKLATSEITFHYFPALAALAAGKERWRQGKTCECVAPLRDKRARRRGSPESMRATIRSYITRAETGQVAAAGQLLRSSSITTAAHACHQSRCRVVHSARGRCQKYGPEFSCEMIARRPDAALGRLKYFVNSIDGTRSCLRRCFRRKTHSIISWLTSRSVSDRPVVARK